MIQYIYEQGWSSLVYNSMTYIVVVIHISFLLYYRKKYDVSAKQAIWTAVLLYGTGYLFSMFLGWAENGFKAGAPNNIVRVYVYLPLIAIPVSKLLKINAGKMIDYVAPSMALQQVYGHSVCPFVGCCRGYESSWGVWNPVTKTTLFPIQWLECLVALAIFFILMTYAKSEKHKGSGMVCALFLILYGSTRFFLEFLRDNEKLFAGISSLAFHALFMTVVGIVWMTIYYEKEKEKTMKKQQNSKKRK